MTLNDWLKSFLDQKKRDGILVGLGITIALLGLSPLFGNTDIFIRYNEMEDTLKFNVTEMIAPYIGADGKEDYNYYLQIKEVDSPCISLMDVKFKKMGHATFRNNYCVGEYLELDYHSLYIEKINKGIDGYEVNVKLYDKKRVGYSIILITIGLILIFFGDLINKFLFFWLKRK